MLARSLADSHDVTIIERGAGSGAPEFPVVDIGRPAGMEPHFGTGLGGSTQLWHNGLIEIDDDTFSAHWPIPKQALDGYYDEAFLLLSRVPIGKVRNAIDDLRRRYRALGLPDAMLPGLYYPRWPMNLWDTFGLERRVHVVPGEVTGFSTGDDGAITGLVVSADGEQQEVGGDVFVFAAGGLGSPVLLQKLAARLDLPALRHAGCYYEDHPMGFVGEVDVTVPLYRLWNFRVRGTDGNLRLPLVVVEGGMQVSFQIRPAAPYYRDSRRQRVGSVLNELRQNPWNPTGYFKLFSHVDDILDILSFKFGIHLPTRHYTLLMMAQMPAAEGRSIWSGPDPAGGREVGIRRWELTAQYRADLQAAISKVLERLAPVVKKSRVFPDWFDAIKTGAHHSGTARMSASADTGVCDADCRVHGVPNLYVCDGSVIPASGIANTGLTIAALALRLADHLQQFPARLSGVPID
jgi:hypothetical protein